MAAVNAGMSFDPSAQGRMASSGPSGVGRTDGLDRDSVKGPEKGGSDDAQVQQTIAMLQKEIEDLQKAMQSQASQPDDGDDSTQATDPKKAKLEKRIQQLENELQQLESGGAVAGGAATGGMAGGGMAGGATF